MNTCQLSLHIITFFFGVLYSNALCEMSSPWATRHQAPPQFPRRIAPIRSHKNMNPLPKNPQETNEQKQSSNDAQQSNRTVVSLPSLEFVPPQFIFFAVVFNPPSNFLS